jgi:hypothetical protein
VQIELLCFCSSLFLSTIFPRDWPWPQ